MICLNIALFIIVATFLMCTLGVGIYFSRRKTSFREYAVGNKEFATATLVATVLATLYGGGGLVRNVETTHAFGLWWIMIGFLALIGFFMISKLAIRMGPFMQHLSMAETIGYIYGTYPRIMAALVGISGCIIGITMQIAVMTQAINMCITLNNAYIIPMLAAFLLIFYSAFGGIRAVTFTDVLQFLTFSMIIPLLAWFMFVKVGKPVSAILPMLQSYTRFQASHLLELKPRLLGMSLLLLSLIISYIQPQLMQRVYMSANPLQAQKVFSYATIFTVVIQFFITLVALFIFVGAPDLAKEKVWEYVMDHIPSFFKGFLVIGLFAMAMSTADSCLNACAVMVTHDILKSLKTKIAMSDAHQLVVARRTTLIVGILAMIISFRCNDLLELMHWGLACVVPMVTAPFILAIFGFRGTARTALIGMATGLFTIVIWNKWIKPSNNMDGSFLAMLANGLAMMAAHYLFKQPKNTGWVEPDNEFKQRQQENLRKTTKRKEFFKNGWANRKVIFAKVIPTDGTIRLTGLYMIITSIVSYWSIRPEGIGWAIGQAFLGTLLTSVKTFFNKVKPVWSVGLIWLIGLVLYLPLNLLCYWWYLVDPIFSASLSLAHCAVILWVLPISLGIFVVASTLIIALYPITMGLPYPVLCNLFPIFIASLLVFAMAISLKVKVNNYSTQILYLKNQEDIRTSQQLKASLYDAAIGSSAPSHKTKGYGPILAQVVRKIEQSVSFLDGNIPLYKQDFQSIINKMYDWIAYFNRREKAKSHVLLQPTKITLDRLIHKVEFALAQEVPEPPRLFVETIKKLNGNSPSPHIICDINQIVYILIKAILRISKIENSHVDMIRIQLHTTSLQFKQADAIENSYPTFMDFQAIAIVISQASTLAQALPSVKERYDDIIDAIPEGQQVIPPSIDLQQETISTIVDAHYGHLEAHTDPTQPTMLLVLPKDVTDIRDKMTANLPIDCLTSEVPLSPKEYADSMMALIKFHDYVAQCAHTEDPIDIKTISGLILLLREHFHFKKHASGQLFYVRAVGIAQLVTDWVFHSPKVVYASLLYQLVRHTCLPISYVKEHYNLGVYTFVSNLVKIDKRQRLDDPSLLYVQNRLEQAIKQEHVQLSVLFIKLAERLYDLRHARGYLHLTEVHHMAQETLTIDVHIAHSYLGPEIAILLEKAAKEALRICNQKANEQRQENDKEQG